MYNVRSADTIILILLDMLILFKKPCFLFTSNGSRIKITARGSQVGEVTEYHDMMQKNPYMTVLDDEQKFEVTEFVRKSILIIDSSNLVPETRTLDVSKLGYEIDIIDAFDVAHNDEIEHGKNVTNYYLVHTDLPFPVEAIQFNTSHIVEPHKEYEFELISFFDASNTLKNNSVNVDITIDNGDTNDVIVESGTIELTLPDDETDSTNGVDDNTENQNDDEIIEINDTNKNNDDSADNTKIKMIIILRIQSTLMMQ
ncbi:hypothetical protein [Nitrosopumilus sp.]|uniref:hypothetical protein n=1 Tax=Nitrosopumilus sp. TaxID=2024843 RepID=UPI00292E2324|nr:hypothetical protein [Nitrosopumilus sp.]